MTEFDLLKEGVRTGIIQGAKGIALNNILPDLIRQFNSRNDEED